MLNDLRFQRYLVVLQEQKPDLYVYFLKEFQKCKTDDNFLGVRFELYVAASLIRKKIDFTKSESPDFLINQEPQVAIECTSARVQDGTPKTEFGYKISSAIKAKEKKGYCNNKTILFIDCTNIFFHSGENTDLEKFFIDATCEADYNSFGSRVLFMHTIDKGSSGTAIQTNFLRFDHWNTSEEVKTFLDIYYPQGTKALSKISHDFKY